MEDEKLEKERKERERERERERKIASQSFSFFVLSKVTKLVLIESSRARFVETIREEGTFSLTFG